MILLFSLFFSTLAIICCWFVYYVVPFRIFSSENKYCADFYQTKLRYVIGLCFIFSFKKHSINFIVLNVRPKSEKEYTVTQLGVFVFYIHSTYSGNFALCEAVYLKWCPLFFSDTYVTHTWKEYMFIIIVVSIF